MNEIIERLIEKTGLPEDKADEAVNVVAGFLKEKLPAPMASQIDNLLAGGPGTGASAGGMLGGLFGNKQ